MRILWITNLILPDAAKAMGLSCNVGGGWMQSALEQIKSCSEVNIAVATVHSGNEIHKFNANGIRYYLLPLKGKSMGTYHKDLEDMWLSVDNEFNPDVIHIHGTEFPHGLAWIRACGGDRTIISIQGLISVIAKYYSLGGEPLSDNLWTLRDIIKRDSIDKTRDQFIQRGRYETEMIKAVKHVIGRTNWDLSHCMAMNNNIIYHYVGETLRESFYNHRWKYEGCEPYSIFISNGTSPIKGLHKMLEALPLILKEFPKTKLYVAGPNPSKKPWFKITGYDKYIKKLIKYYNLHGHIEFKGNLDEKGMCSQYLKSNVFVSCSAIENSSNSLGEALMLQMPCIASFVGGSMDLVDYNVDLLYRYEEVEMLAQKINSIFRLGNSYKVPSIDTGKYDGRKNLDLLMSAYKTVVENKY